MAADEIFRNFINRLQSDCSLSINIYLYEIFVFAKMRIFAKYNSMESGKKVHQQTDICGRGGGVGQKSTNFCGHLLWTTLKAL